MKHMMIKVLSLVMALTMIMGMFGAVALSAAEHVHTKGEKVKTVAPTCVAYGYTLYECADCGETYADDVLSKTGVCANIVDVEAVAATCTSNAKAAGKKCADCGDVKEGCDSIPGTKLAHNMVIAITQPTCDENGEVYEYCTTCDTVRNRLEDLKALGNDGKHKTEFTITKAPSCGESGLATWGCTECDEYTVEGIYVAPNPDLHVWVKVEDAPTCTAAGFIGWECTECWNTTTVNPETGVELENGGLIDAYNHTNDVVVITKDNYEGYAYFINNNFKVADLSLAPTCDEDGFHYVYCNDCEQVLKITDKALKHTFENWYNEDTSSEDANYIVERVAATCETAGYVVVKCDNYATCDCDETKTIVEKDALNKDHKHNWWSELTTQYKGDIASGYKWNIVEATCETAGYTIVVCTNKDCTATKKFDAVDALGHNYEYRCEECGDDECLNCTHARALVCVDNDDRDGCGATKAVTVQEAHNKSKDKDVKTIPATCSQYAYDTYYCKNKDCAYLEASWAITDDEGKVIYDTEAGYDADNHSDLKEMVITPSTCLTEGKVRYSCYNCSVGTWDEALPVLKKHDEYRTEYEEVAATCTNKGWTAGTYCQKCYELGADADGWVKGHTATEKNAANHETAGATVTFHRPGTCKIVELTVYTCARPECKGAKFNVEGELDAYNHNKYVYVSNVLNAAQSSSIVTEAPDYVAEETHWGACLVYTAALQTCLDDGYHSNVKCSECNTVVGVTEFEFVKYTVEAVEDDPETEEDETVAGLTADESLLWVINQDTNGDETVSSSDRTCEVCRKYASSSYDMNGDGVKEWEPSPHITYTYLYNEDGSYQIDPSTKRPLYEPTYEVQLVIPATGHTFIDKDAIPETCETPGYTAGKNCSNAWAKDLAALKDKDTTNDNACGYKEGQTFIPAHGDKYTEEYKGVVPTCSTSGLGTLITANVYRDSRYIEYVVIPQVKKSPTKVLYAGQYLIEDGDNYKVIEAKDYDATTMIAVITPTTSKDDTINGFTFVNTKLVAIGGEYCTKCDDLTKDPYYVAPLDHNFVVNTVANSCTTFGWVEIKCSNCTDNGPHWIDRDGDNVVDVEVEWNNGAIANAKAIELSWFITEFEYADGHAWPKYDDETASLYEKNGWIVLGEVISEDYAEVLNESGFENVFGHIDSCTTDSIKYIECATCEEKKTVGDATVATGHYINQTDGTKTYISTACNEISKWVGYTCDNADECGVSIGKTTTPTHDLVAVQVAETCTKTGLQACYACVDCDDYFAVYVNEDDEIDLIALDFTPTKDEAAAVGYDIDLMRALIAGIVIPKHEPTITKVDAYVPATETVDGYWTYTCGKCGESVTKVLALESQLVLDITVEDVNGAKVTANGNEIVVKVAYTAKEYKFRALDLGFEFDNYALTFNKAEVKTEYDAALNVITEVAVDENEINVLTYVPNGLKQNATLAGEDVAFIYFYFTVNAGDIIIDAEVEIYDNETPDDITDDETYYYGEFYLNNVSSKFYDDDTKANVEQDQTVYCNYDYELEVGMTGDVDDSFEIDYSDLLDMMDAIYTENAKYNAMADINKDGAVDVADFAALKTFVVSKQTVADYAEMVGVEIPDFEALLLNAVVANKLDMNDDDIINKLDLMLLTALGNEASDILSSFIDLDNYGDWNEYFDLGLGEVAAMSEAELVDIFNMLVLAASIGIGI